MGWGRGSDKKNKKRININQNEEFKYLTGNFWCSSYVLIMSLNSNIFHIYHSIIDIFVKAICLKILKVHVSRIYRFRLWVYSVYNHEAW